MKKAFVIFFVILITACNIPTSKNVLNNLGGNKYVSGGGYKGEVITLKKDSTFEVYFYSCTIWGTEFTGSWYLQGDTLTLFRENMKKYAKLDKNVMNVEHRIKFNKFESLKFLVGNIGIELLSVDSISVIDSNYSYRLSR